jgi:hypothetical protein
MLPTSNSLTKSDMFWDFGLTKQRYFLTLISQNTLHIMMSKTSHCQSSGKYKMITLIYLHVTSNHSDKKYVDAVSTNQGNSETFFNLLPNTFWINFPPHILDKLPPKNNWYKYIFILLWKIILDFNLWDHNYICKIKTTTLFDLMSHNSAGRDDTTKPHWQGKS